MVHVARERIFGLFALAEREAVGGQAELANRYVRLARRIGTRYNVRLLPEYRELYCRGCSTYWVEGRTVRTRLRGGRRVRTCLACGRQRRTAVRPARGRIARGLESSPERVPREEGALAEEVPVEGSPAADDDEEAEPE
jgi:ribonuclease P protein subunit RPR2